MASDSDSLFIPMLGKLLQDLDCREEWRKLGTLSPKRNASIQSLPSGLREIHRRVGRNSQESGWMEDTRKTRPAKSTQWKPSGTHGDWGSLHRACTGLLQVLSTSVVASSLVLSRDSWLCQPVGLWSLCLLLDSCVGLFCPVLMY